MLPTVVLCEYSKFSNTYCHRFLTYLTEWRRFFTLATTSSNQQNLLLTMVQVLYLLEVFILAHYGPSVTETPTATIVRCHKNSWIYLTSAHYWWLETNDNYLIRNEKELFARDLRSFEIRFEFESADSIRFESDWLIRKFSNRIGRACSFARRKLSQKTQTINGT